MENSNKKWYDCRGFINIGSADPYVVTCPRYVINLDRRYIYGLDERIGLEQTIDRLIKTERRIDQRLDLAYSQFRREWLQRHRDARLQIYERKSNMVVVDRRLATLVDIPVEVTVEEALELCKKRMTVQADFPDGRAECILIGVDGESEDYEVTFIVEVIANHLEKVSPKCVYYA